MTYLDIGVLVLLILGGIIGLLKGVKNKIARLVAYVGAFAIALLFYSMLSNLILTKTGLGETFANFFADKIMSNAKGEVLTLLNMPYKDVLNAGESLLKEAFGSAGIPNFFVSFFTTKVYITEGSVALAIGSSFASAVVYAVVFVLLFVISFIILKLLTKTLLGLGDPNKKGIIDRLFGLVWYVFATGAAILVIMLILIGISYAVPDLKSWLYEQAHVGSDYVSIGSLFYNWAWQIINAFKMSF